LMGRGHLKIIVTLTASVWGPGTRDELMVQGRGLFRGGIIAVKGIGLWVVGGYKNRSMQHSMSTLIGWVKLLAGLLEMRQRGYSYAPDEKVTRWTSGG